MLTGPPSGGLDGVPASGRKDAALQSIWGAANEPSVHADALGTALRPMLKPDGTAECEECGMPMFPTSRAGGHVHLDCANRHYLDAPLPDDPTVVRLIDNWISKRGAQLHVQHERWGTDDKSGRDERDI